MPLLRPLPEICYVEVSGGADDLDYLELVAPIFGAQLARQDANVLLHAPTFSESGGDLQAKCREFTAKLNHSALLVLGRRLNIQVGPVWTFDKSGHRHHFMVISETATMTDSVRLEIRKPGGTVVSRYPEDQLVDAARAAASRPYLDTALRLFANQGDSWQGLYKVKEALEEAFGDLPKAGFTSRSALKRFSGTANSFGVVGDDARHAQAKIAKPNDTMTLQEARTLFRGMLMKALQ